jgi:hypothetical protein
MTKKTLSKEQIIKIAELVARKVYLEKTDTEKEEMRKSNPYAFGEGFTTSNMDEIDDIDEEIEKI